MINKKTKDKSMQEKPKKTNQQKSIIAAHVIMYTFIAYFLAASPLVISSNYYNKDLNKLENEKIKVYEEFMKSDSFSKQMKQDIINTAEEYANGVITYEEFEEKIKYFKSVANAQVILGNSNNELNETIAKIDKKIEARKQKFKDSPHGEITSTITATAVATMLGAVSAYVTYSIKDVLDDKKKKQKEQSKPIQSNNHYAKNLIYEDEQSNSNQNQNDGLTK